jgi:hypothetical protein
MEMWEPPNGGAQPLFTAAAQRSSTQVAIGECSAQTEWETSADGTEFMDTTLKALKSSLEAIRDMAMKALNQIEHSQEEHSMLWKCKACRFRMYRSNT